MESNYTNYNARPVNMHAPIYIEKSKYWYWMSGRVSSSSFLFVSGGSSRLDQTKLKMRKINRMGSFNKQQLNQQINHQIKSKAQKCQL